MSGPMKIIQKTFGFEKFNYFQQLAFEVLLDKHDVFVGTKTGSGKTIIYESMGVMNKEIVTVVVAQLQSNMEEQVEKLQTLDLSAIYIISLKIDMGEVIAGKYQFLYGSP